MVARVTLAGFVVLASAFGIACGSDSSSQDASPSDAGPPPADAPPFVDLTEAMFDPDVVLDIDITLDAADWDALRIQGRSVTDLVGAQCLEAPLFRIYDYFPATITVNGVEVTNVGVRKKGLIGSLSPTKPSLKISFDEFVPGQEHSGMERLTLNNARSDRGYMNQCLGYERFAAAGLPAPRCNYANVTVNGQNLGLYVHVEGIKKRFLARHFADNGGNLYEGTLSDYRSDLVQTFERKTNKTDLDRTDLDAVASVAETASDATLVDELSAVIDVDQYITFWAMEQMLGHNDGYAGNQNNFYAYRDPTSGVFAFIPWGIDSVFRGGVATTGTIANGAIARRLAMYQPTLDMYWSRVNELFDTAWDEAAMFAEIDRTEALIRPYLTEADTGFDDRLVALREIIQNRRAEFAAVDPPDLWTAPPRPVPCLDVYGTLTASFATSWATFGQDPLAAGSGNLSGTLFGNSLSVVDVGAVAGYGGQDLIEAGVGVLATLTDGSVLVLIIDTPAPLFVPGATVNLDWSGSFATLYSFDMGNPVPIGLIADGTVQFSEATTTDGLPVSGTISGTIYDTFPSL